MTNQEQLKVAPIQVLLVDNHARPLSFQVASNEEALRRINSAVDLQNQWQAEGVPQVGQFTHAFVSRDGLLKQVVLTLGEELSAGQQMALGLR